MKEENLSLMLDNDHRRDQPAQDLYCYVHQRVKFNEELMIEFLAPKSVAKTSLKKVP